jgi:hypothetical protein
VPKNLGYFVGSVHFTAKRNKAIADTLFETIVSNQLISQ